MSGVVRVGSTDLGRVAMWLWLVDDTISLLCIAGSGRDVEGD